MSKPLTCLRCGGPTLRGDLRSGFTSFGDYFVEFDGDKMTLLGTPKLKSGLERDNRVVSYACTKCGFISSYLERVLKTVESEEGR
jgi:hypothetical protein